MILEAVATTPLRIKGSGQFVEEFYAKGQRC